MCHILPVGLQNILHCRQPGMCQQGMTEGRNYHFFSHGGLNILLDVPTGAVHVLDDIAAKVLPYFAAGNIKDMGKEFSSEISEATLAWEQLQGLADGKMLFSPQPHFSQRPGGGELKALCLHVAHDCDLRCRYCFAGTGAFGGARTLMDLATAKAAVDMLFSSAAKVYEIDFFGGEPLLNLGVVEETSAYARQQAKALGKKVNLTLTTNGYSMNQSVRDRLVALNLDIILSHDGRQDVHNATRPCPGGLPSYQDITRNILELVPRLGEKYYIRGTYTALNKDFVQDIRHWLDLGLRRFSMEPVVLPPSSKMALTQEDLAFLREQYWQLAELAQEEPFTYFHFNLDWERGQCGARRASGCGACIEYVAVDPKGGIFPCHQFVGEDAWQLGTVHTGITNKSIPEQFLKLGIESKPICQKCWARFHCGGGCHANAWWTNSNLDQPYDLGCQLLKMRTEAAIYLKVKQALSLNCSEGDFHGIQKKGYKQAQ